MLCMLSDVIIFHKSHLTEIDADILSSESQTTVALKEWRSVSNIYIFLSIKSQ